VSSNQYIEDRLIRHQIRTLRLANGTASEMNKALKSFLRVVTDRINTQGAEPLTPIQISEVRRLVKKEIGSLELEKTLIKNVEEFIDLEVEYTEKLLAMSIDSTLITKTSTEALKAVITDKPMQLVPNKQGAAAERLTPRQAVNKFSSKMESSVTLVLQNGYANGESAQETAEKISNLVTRRGYRQSEALTRTVYNHMGSEARSSVASANARYFEGEEYVATLDLRTTIVCAGYDGQLFPVDNGPIPPLHYNCRSLRIPKVKDRFKIPGLEGERPAKGTDGVQQVSGQTKYSSWLARQSNDFQEEVLGKRRAELFRSGKVKLQNFTDQQGTLINLKDLRDKDGQPILD